MQCWAFLFSWVFFAGCYHPSVLTTLSENISRNKIGKAVAFYTVGGTIGFFLSPILGGIIGGTIGWRYAFIILGIPALFAALIVFIKVRPKTADKGSSKPSAQTRAVNNENRDGTASKQGTLAKTLQPVIIIIILVVLTQHLAGSVVSFTSKFMRETHNLDPIYAVMFVSIIRGGGIIGSLFGGWLSDRWNRKNAIYTTLIITGPMLYLATILPFNTMLIIVFACLGVLIYMKGTTALPFLLDNTPLPLRSTILGIYLGLAREGISLADPVAGYFMDKYGIDSVFNVIALSGIALSAVTLLLFKKPAFHRRGKNNNRQG